MTLNQQTNSKPTTDHVPELVALHFASSEGELAIGGIGVGELAARYGTPLFVYDRGVLASQLKALRQALPSRFDVFYSVKANPNQEILRFFVQQGCGLEIASSGELRQAIAAGCSPERIFFAGPGKTQAELQSAVECGIGEIHVESLREAQRLELLARKHGRRVPIALRVNPAGDVEAGGMRMGGRAVPFGIDEDQLDDIVSEIRLLEHLDVVGLHLFIGTQILDHQLLVKQYDVALDIAQHIGRMIGKPLSTIDFGGGLGVPYFAHEQALDLNRLRSGLAGLTARLVGDPCWEKVRLVVEPGRFLVAPCGIYLVRVTDVKVSRGKKFVITDGGMHHHLAASGNLGQTIKRNYPVAVVNKLDATDRETVDVVGPLCTPLDMLARAIDLPPVEEGDLIAVFQSGAYARAASPLGFLSRQAPPEVMVEAGCDWLSRIRGSDEDFLHDQVDAALAPRT